MPRRAAPRWCDLLGFPCTNTLMGLGGYPGDRPAVPRHARHARHLRSQHGDAALRRAAGRRRALRRPGDRQSRRTSRQVPRKIIHIDIDPSSISKRVKVDVPIVGDVARGARRADQAARGAPAAARRRGAGGLVDADRGVAAHGLPASTTARATIIKPQYVVEKLCEVTGGDAFVTSDVGQHQMWAAQYYKFDKPRRWINSGRPGHDGLRPALRDGRAAGQSRRRRSPASPAKASIQMCIQELSTCKQYRLPIKIVNLNNRYLGMVRQWQQIVLRQPLLRVLHGCAARFRQAGREPTATSACASSNPRDVEPRAAGGASSSRIGWCSWISSPTRPRTSVPMVAGRQGPDRDDLLGSEDL